MKTSSRGAWLPKYFLPFAMTLAALQSAPAHAFIGAYAYADATECMLTIQFVIGSRSGHKSGFVRA